MRIPSRTIIPFAPRPSSGLGASDLLKTVGTLAADYYTGGAASAAGAAAGGAASGDAGYAPPGAGGNVMPGNTTVSPAIQTTISPQISPVFQQSYMPKNSAMTAGTTQTAPSSQSATSGQPGMPPDAGMGYPGAGGGGMPGATDAGMTPYDTGSGGGYAVSSSRISFWSKYQPYILGGAAILIGTIILLQLKKRRK